MSLSKEVTKALKNTGYLPDINGEASATNSSSVDNSNPEDNANGPPIVNAAIDDPQPGPSGVSASNANNAPTAKNVSTSSSVASNLDYRVTRAVELYKKFMKDLQIGKDTIFSFRIWLYRLTLCSRYERVFNVR